jgi:cyclophilin family peptidyl-prolyl cis-trans isomerase
MASSRAGSQGAHASGPLGLVVLGCRVQEASLRPGEVQGEVRVGGALRRRVVAAASEWERAQREDAEAERPAVVIASGGRSWDGEVEADAMAAALAALGVPGGVVVRERASLHTKDNARFTAAVCARQGIARVAIVTCGWHLPRARMLFEAEGLAVAREVSAGEGGFTWSGRRWIRAKEWLLRALAVLLVGCPGKHEGATPLPADAEARFDSSSIARAEDLRRAKDVPELARVSHDVELRRGAARALARIGEADGSAELLRALEDEDPTTAAWGAYGLGESCKGHEEANVRALAARAVWFGGDAGGAEGGRDAIDPRVAIARAVGRCGGEMAEEVLASWVRRRDALASAAAYALGDVAGRRAALADETVAALLEAATPGSAPGGAPVAEGLDAALYPFGRLEHVPDSIAPRVAKAALATLGGRGVARAFAVRALGRTGPRAAEDLERVTLDHAFSPAERADAARALRSLGEEGHAAAAEALAQMAPSKDPFELLRVAGDDYGILTSLVAALGTAVPKKSEPALFALAAIPTAGTPPSVARRLGELRCGAAAVLAKGAYDAEVLGACDAESSEAFQEARLTSLLRRKLVGERRAAWRALTRSPHVKVREAALEAIADHPELADAARAALAEALGAKQGGVVATAAGIIHAHPDRVLVLSEKERRAALDPGAPAPTSNPLRTLDPAIASALAAALARAWPEDLVETKTALLDAAVAVSLEGARAAVTAACHDRNATIRERAAKALRGLGDSVAPASPHGAPIETISCAPPADAGAPAPELGHTIDHDVRVTFSTDAGDLSIVFEPALAPIAATRFVALAKGGFYDGIVVHRVVPGFVAQFGDPDGDGYGGAGELLRCETSPVPFGSLDVGVALAGRDTGSSQLFVTLARVPHLDGEYARVGRAEGDWWSVAEGDVIRSVKVAE